MSRSFKETAILGLAAVAALASGSAAPTLGAAQPYGERHDYYEGCARERSGNTAAGAIIGGIAGAAIGSGLSEGRGGGALAGALLGGTAGAAIGHGAATDCGGYYDHHYYYRRHPTVIYKRPYYPYPDYDYAPAPYPYYAAPPPYDYDDDD